MGGVGVGGKKEKIFTRVRVVQSSQNVLKVCNKNINTIHA